MTKYLARKDNIQFYIQEYQVADYISLGYTIYKEEPVEMTEDELEELTSTSDS